MRYQFLINMYKIPNQIVTNIHNANELLDVINNKFTAQNAKIFIDYSELPLNIWEKLLPISLRTLNRWLQDERKLLDAIVSETFIEIGEIYDIGLEAFEDDKKRLIDWLFTENPYFEGKKPIDIMNMHKGRDLVKDELIRIDYSEFS